MAKTKISEFDSNPSNNTDIDGINIAEGCAPSGINNAIRELMSQLKDQQTGASDDNFTVGGNFAVDGTSTFTGATTFTGAVVFSSTVNGSSLGNMASQNKNAIDITGGTITGITDLAVADGGTGASSLSANAVLLGNGTSAIQTVAPSTSGNVLTSNGTTWTSAALPQNGLGIDQTWQNLTSSRVTGTTYTNSTGKPIQVNVVMGNYIDAAVNMTLSVDGITVSTFGYGRAGVGDNGNGTCTAIVPNGSSYVVTGTWTNWYELR